MNIAIIYSLPTQRTIKYSPSTLIADEDTKLSAMEIARALKNKGHKSYLVPVSENNVSSILKIKADCIFNLIEWTGDDLHLVKKVYEYIDQLKIPYTGSNWKCYKVTTDKLLMKKYFQKYNISTPKWQIFKKGDEIIDNDFSYPLFVKPSRQHCSIGINSHSVVKNSKDTKKMILKMLKTFDEPILLEEYISGREFQVTIIEKDGKPTVLPPAEIEFYKGKTPKFLTFDSRWNEDKPDYLNSEVDVAKLSNAELNKLTDLSLYTYVQMNLSGYARLDVREKNGDFFILEANSNPGLGDDEYYGMTVSYKKAGMNFADFIELILKSATDKKR